MVGGFCWCFYPSPPEHLGIWLQRAWPVSQDGSLFPTDYETILLWVNNPPWSNTVKLFICFYGCLSIVSRERRGNVTYSGLFKLLSIIVALKTKWKLGFFHSVDSLSNSNKSFLMSGSDLRPHHGHPQYTYFLGLKGKFWFSPHLPSTLSFHEISNVSESFGI